MDIFRSNTILDSFESSPALRYNLFFAFAMPTQKKRIFTAIGARTSGSLSFENSNELMIK